MPRAKEIGLARTLGQLMAIVAVCKRCRWQTTLFPRSLAERYGSDLYSIELQDRVRCCACGTLGAKVYERAR